MKSLKKNAKWYLLTILFLVNVLIWQAIFTEQRNDILTVAFLDVDLAPLDALEELTFLGLTNLLVFFSIEDVGLGHFEKPTLGQHHLDQILDVLDTRDPLDELLVEERGDVVGYARVKLITHRHTGCHARFLYRLFDTRAIEINDGAISLLDFGDLH